MLTILDSHPKTSFCRTEPSPDRQQPAFARNVLGSGPVLQLPMRPPHSAPPDGPVRPMSQSSRAAGNSACRTNSAMPVARSRSNDRSEVATQLSPANGDANTNPSAPGTPPWIAPDRASPAAWLPSAGLPPVASPRRSIGCCNGRYGMNQVAASADGYGQAASSTVTTRRFLKRARASSSLPILVAWRGSSMRRTSLSWTPMAAAKALLDSRCSRRAS